MKLFLGLLVALAISSAFALPAARSPKDEVDIIDVPRGEQDSSQPGEDSNVDPNFKDFKGVVDTGVGYPFFTPLPHPFSFNLGFFDSFEDIFRRLRSRLWQFDSDESSDEGSFSLGLVPTNGANTTSIVKVVDGHKVEINDTVYGTGNENGGPILKFRVINIRPLEAGEQVPEVNQTSDDSATTPKERDVEGNSDEKSDSHEDPKSSDNEINANIDDPEVKYTKN